MRPSFIVSLILLSLFLTKAQGIRLDKGSFAAQQHKQHIDESNLLKRNKSDDKEAILCKDDQQCTGALKKRVSRVSRKPRNRLPRIHEDYCGPRHHRPRHH